MAATAPLTEEAVEKGFDPATASITNHAIKRYWERVPDSNDLDGPEVERLLRERLAAALVLWRKPFAQPEEKTEYLMDGNMIFVVNPFDNTLVTLYPAEYGFGPDIDAFVRGRLLHNVKALHEKIAKAEDAVRKVYSSTSHELEAIALRTATLKAELESLEYATATLNARRSRSTSEQALLAAKLEEEAGKLIFSKRYNTETLAAVSSIANQAAKAKR